MTELARHMDAADFEDLQSRTSSRGGLQLKTVEAGAATSVYAATAPEMQGRGGVYLEDCHVAGIDDDPEATGGVRSYALDPEAARRLWTISEEMVGQPLDL